MDRPFSTPGYVKLLLPPRQSRGVSYCSLDHASIPFQPDSAGATTVSTDTLYVSQAYELTVSRSRITGGGSCFSNPYPGQPGDCTCPDGPCKSWSAGAYLLSGIQMITVMQIDDHLRLAANPASGPAGTQVTFTPSTDDGSNFSVWSWRWVPDDSTAGDSTAACSNGVTPCTTHVYASGTMYVLATVGGRTRQASAHVTIVPGRLKLTASTTHVPDSGSVTFTASADAAGQPVPVTVTQWTWHPDSGAAVPNICSPALQCTINPVTSGVMTVAGVVSGTAQVAQASVWVTDCPYNDSTAMELDTKEVHDFLKTMWDSSGATNPNTAMRREYPGYQFDSAGIVVTRFYPNGATPCSSPSVPIPPYPGTFLRGGHPHPFRIHDLLPTSVPACTDSLGTQFAYGHGLGGPSKGDWKRIWSDSVTLGYPITELIIDRDSVYRARTPADSLGSDWSSKVKGYPRKVGSCDRIS